MKFISLFLRKGMHQLQNLSCYKNLLLELVTQLLHNIHEKALDKYRTCMTGVFSYQKISWIWHGPLKKDFSELQEK